MALAEKVRRRTRLLQLLDAAERAGVTPLQSARLHAFAYLADVLSPVWGLIPFTGTIYKFESRPHYVDLQEELDELVVLGLVSITGLKYVDRGDEGARVDGCYSLNFASSHLGPLLAAIGCESSETAIDPSDVELHDFLVELASALATLPDDEIDLAASADITFNSPRTLNNVVDFGAWTEDRWSANGSWRTTERFQTFLPSQSTLSPGEKLFLYAAYLGQVIDAA